MPSPSAVFTELVASTMRNHGRKVIDNFSGHNYLVRHLRKKGNYDLLSGGTTIAHPLEYQANSTYQRYSGYDALNIQASEVFTAVEFPWRNVAVHVTANGPEMRANSGKEAMFKLASSRLKNAIRTFENNMNSDLYSNGSLTNQVGGLQLLVADAGTGTVGGIDSSANTFWRNIVQSHAAPLQGGGAVTAGSTTIERMMMHTYMAATRNADVPDLWIADNNYYGFFDESQVSMKRYVDEEDAKAGFQNLTYKGAKVVFDGNGGCPANHMYALNTEYIRLCVHEAANLTVLDDKVSVNQDATVIPLIWQGNLICTNRARQAVIKA